MQVSIVPSERRKGWFLFRYTEYTVTTTVEFDEIEKAIIKQRNLKNNIVISDKDEKLEIMNMKLLISGGFIYPIIKFIVIGLIRGWSYNHKAMTIEKLMHRPYKQTFDDIIDQKLYIDNLKEGLHSFKDVLAMSVEDAKTEVFAI